MTILVGNKFYKLKTKSSAFPIVKIGAASPTPIKKFIVQVQPNDSSMGQTFGSGEYVEGSIVEIRAIANEGYSFTHWSDGNGNAVRQITVGNDIELTAYFEQVSLKGTMEYVPNRSYRNQ